MIPCKHSEVKSFENAYFSHVKLLQNVILGFEFRALCMLGRCPTT
jgi:hypothetical protein